MGQIIVTGSPRTENAALIWLQERGATVEDSDGLKIVDLPLNAEITGSCGEYAISISTNDEDEEDTSYVKVDLSVDASETILKLHR